MESFSVLLTCWAIYSIMRFDLSYTRWTKHGETYECSGGDRVPDVSSASNVVDTDMCDESDDLEEMLNVVGEEDPKMFETLKSDAEMPLYV